MRLMGRRRDALVPLSETFALHSLPGAHHTLYLDFGFFEEVNG